MLAYTLRVYLLRGFYIVTYGIAIYNLNLVIGFLTPAFDPEAEEPGLPTDSAEAEFKPFVRRLPEFKFWCAGGGGPGGALALTQEAPARARARRARARGGRAVWEAWARRRAGCAGPAGLRRGEGVG